MKKQKVNNDIDSTRGITWVTPKLRDVVMEIKRSAPDGSSRIYSEEQRAQMLMKIKPHRIKAEVDGKSADIKFIERSSKSVNKLKLAKTTHRLKKFRIE